jgi:hypothetical protein
MPAPRHICADCRAPILARHHQPCPHCGEPLHLGCECPYCPDADEIPPTTDDDTYLAPPPNSLLYPTGD